MANRVFNFGGLGILLATFMVACGSQPETFAPNTTDRFVNHDREFYAQAAKVLAADYLFVVDPSYSNWGNKASIQSTLDSFITNLEGSDIDFRVGFLNGNFQATSSGAAIPSDQGTTLIGESFLYPGFASNASIISDFADTVGDPLAANRTVPLETAARYITKNKKFARSGAQLVYVFITDSEDRSDTVSGGHSGNITANHYYVTQLKKPKTDSAYVSARAIVAGNFNGVGGGCSGTTGKRVYDTAFYLNQASAPAGPHNYCINDSIDLNLNSVATDVTKPTTRFQLLEKPIEKTIEVLVDGATQVKGVAYKYLPGSNEIVFQPGHIPGTSAQLEIKYDILFSLSSTPKTESIQVSVDGTTLDKSDWKYVPNGNRIEFINKPGTDAEVLVSYEVQ